MQNSLIRKVIIIMMYIIIIIMISLLLDILFRLTVRKNRKSKIKYLAKKKSLDKNKALIIFNNRFKGIVINSSTTDSEPEEFEGDIVEIVNLMENDSCVVMVSETLEYIDSTSIDELGETLLSKTIKQLKNISGGDFYSVNIEKNSPRIFWDYKIKNIMDKSFYLPDDNITWYQPNDLQLKIQDFYRHIFKILPYDFFAYDPIKEIK